MRTKQNRLIGMAYSKPLNNWGRLLKCPCITTGLCSLLFTEATLSDGDRNL